MMPVTATTNAQDDILNATFRANPLYELVPFDHLPPQQQELLADLRQEPGMYGILRPKQETALPLKSVCRDTALLVYTLQSPHAIPSCLLDGRNGAAAELLKKLVLDGVLEIYRSGEFLSGARAARLFLTRRTEYHDAGLARLSREALEYAQHARTTDAAKLSAMLYQYNRMPLSPVSLRSVGDVEKFMDIHEEGDTGRTIRKRWHRNERKNDADGWISWTNRNRDLWFHRMNLTYKLYVSPRPEDLPQALRRVAPVAAEAGALHMKIGRQPAGILRPDKFVLYFATEESLRHATECLREEVAGLSAHGVPFTAGIDESGLLSWGIDPPSEERMLSWLPQPSWRNWVTTRLAIALANAKTAAELDREPWQYALERVELEGVDTQTWTPSADLWPSMTGVVEPSSLVETR